jgi:hypothetical protein
MIARFSILLPFDLLITENEQWASVDLTSPDHRVRIYVPFLAADRPQAIATVLGATQIPMKPPSFTDNMLVGGKRVAQVNVLIMDFMKDQFERADDPKVSHEPKPEVAFEIANEFLMRIRIYSRVAEIIPVTIQRDPWWARYLTDEGKELELEEGKIRGYRGGISLVGRAAITPDVLQTTAARWNTAEPYTWDLLMLDARASLPDVGSSIVMAAAALARISHRLTIQTDRSVLRRAAYGGRQTEAG